MTGAVEAITGAARAIRSSFAALIGKSSGSIRAMNAQMRVIYERAPDYILSCNPGLADYQVDEIVARMVDDELCTESSEWSFVRFPDRRDAIARRAVRYYIRERADYRDSRARAEAVYLELRDDESPEPLSSLCARELEAAVDRALKDLSPAHWETFCAVVYCGLSHAEVAQLYGCSVSLVASRMTDSRAAARAAARAYVDRGSSPLPEKMQVWKPKPAKPEMTGISP